MRTNTGSVDLFTSRRINYDKCTYWCVDDAWSDMHPNEIAVQKKPTGFFFANEEDMLSFENQIIASAFVFQSATITLSTSDYIPELKPNDLVKHDDIIYRVTAVRTRPYKRHQQYSKNPSKKTYIALKG